MKRLRNDVSNSFLNAGGNWAVWKSHRVDQMVQCGLPNNTEQRASVTKKLALEKYPWNFGVMVEILQQSGAMDGFFRESMTAKEVDRMAHALMLLLMFELGPRMSNITGENSKQRDLPGPRDDDGEGEEDDDKIWPAAKDMRHAMVWGDWEFEIITLNKEGKPLWGPDSEYLTEWWRGGPLFYIELRRRGELWHVRMAKTRFLTGKASRNARNAAAQMKTAEIARRTTPEAFCLEFLVSWALWSGMRASKTPGDGLDNVFLRRGIVAKGKRATSKKLRATDAVKMVKGMAQAKGVDKGHVASKGMRYGFVCAGYLFFQNEIEARSKAVRSAKERGCLLSTYDAADDG